MEYSHSKYTTKSNNRENTMKILELSTKLLSSDTNESMKNSVLSGAISVLEAYDDNETESMVVDKDLWFSLLNNESSKNEIKDLNYQIKSLTKKLQTRTNRVSILKEQVKELQSYNSSLNT